MNTLHKFQTDTFINALKVFFQELKVPVNYISDFPISAKEILSSTYKENDSFQLIKDVYSVGIIDDAAFDGLKSIDTNKINSDYDGILLFGIELNQRNNGLLPTRSQLAEIARAFNREFFYTPVVVIFKYGNYIAFANTERMKYKQEWREGEKVGKVTLLRDINITDIHSGHLRIIQNLQISRTGKSAVNDFKSLYKYWQDVLSVSLLNKVFYKELSNWYFWAIQEVRFPNEPLQIEFDSFEKFDEALKEHKGKNVIRLLTRLLFIWFIKEKGLIPEEIFDEKEIAARFIDGFTPEKPEGSFVTGKHSSKYYRAILQNLFFATLNQTRGERQFRSEGKHMNATQLMRYKSYLKEPEYFVSLMENKVPFMNGGLFECLDKPHPTLKGAHGGDRIIYIDGFSDRPDNELVVPDFLFFDKDEELDLSKEYGSAKSKKEKTKGLFNILKSYKFTITENTPIDEDVALDPELLGKVFENLLASYNPETKTTARKQTGSFYTPREIVNYMVEESLIAYLKNELTQTSEKLSDNIDNDLQQLVSFSEVNPFENNASIQLQIIKALDKCKILDPACGSGAYPMGILQKMVHILNKIDPGNTIWKKVQEENAKKEASDAVVLENKKEREERLKEISDAFDQNINNPDYARKLFLIENCIYGVDIQPIATQISKLRFFISLVVDQKVEVSKNNFGIRPLPNLETKFVAANTLIGLPNEIQGSLFDKREVRKLENELKKVRHKLFSVKTPSVKRELRSKDKELREQMQAALAEQLGNETAQLLAQWDPYDQNISSPFFDKEWMFDISEGFDVVIGNPPYINFSKEGGNISKLYQNRNFETYEKTGDIYSLFYENGIKLLNFNGNLNYITSNKWMKANYGMKLRKYISKFNPLILIDLGADIFETATVDTNILTVIKEQNKNDCFGLDLTKVNKINSIRDYYDNGVSLYKLDSSPWNINNNENADLSYKLFKNNKLKTYNIKINRGLVTGDNKGLVLDLDEFNSFKSNIEEENLKYLKPYILGENLKKYGNNCEKFLICIPKSTKIDSNSVFYKKLEERNKNLNFSISNRSEKGAYWYDLRGCTFYNKFEKEIIVWSDILSEPSFNIIKGIYVDTSAYFLHSEFFNLKYLLGILNSKITKYLIKQVSPVLGSDTIRWKKTFLEEIPFIIAKDQEPYINIVNQILDRKKAGQDTSALEHQIDVMVYHLYELSYEEACVIDSRLSREDFEKYKL